VMERMEDPRFHQLPIVHRHDALPFRQPLSIDVI
jgi:hypothetical protein